jgi:hypothetical protein
MRCDYFNAVYFKKFPDKERPLPQPLLQYTAHPLAVWDLGFLRRSRRSLGSPGLWRRAGRYQLTALVFNGNLAGNHL